MITNFKIYEELHNSKFKKGDLVIAINLHTEDILLKNYLENTVGRIINNININKKLYYEVYYKNVPIKVLSNFWMDDIFTYSENEIRLATPEEIEMFYNINKFNI